MVYLKDAKYLNGYKIELKFDDGAEKIVDLESSLEGEIFEPLKDLEYFARIEYDSELGTVIWPNGADFAPEFLYGLTNF